MNLFSAASLICATLLVLPVFASDTSKATPPSRRLPIATTAAQAMEEGLKKQQESVEKQRSAIHRQLAQKTTVAATSTARFIEPFPPLQPAWRPTWNPIDCPALAADRVNELVSAAARSQDLDPALLRAVMKQESGFKPCAVSPKGAQGLMQLMPSTAQNLHVANAFDPEQNVQGGAAYLKQLLGRYKGDLRLALVGYNAGPGRADVRGASYPLETQDYVASILAALGMSQANDAAPAPEVGNEGKAPRSLPVAAESDDPDEPQP